MKRSQIISISNSPSVQTVDQRAIRLYAVSNRIEFCQHLYDFVISAFSVK